MPFNPNVRPENYQPPKSAEELLARYAQGERYFAETDLPDGSDLENSNLEDANFAPGSFLTDCNFRNANLRNTNFSYCNIKVSDFQNADFAGAILTGALVCGARFEGARDVSFEGAEWYGCLLKAGDDPRLGKD